MFQMPQYKTSFGNDWGALPQFDGISGYGDNTVGSLTTGLTSAGGPSSNLLNPVGGGAGSGWLNSDFLFGSQNNNTGIKTNGALGAGVGLLQAGWGAYNGMQQLKLGKEGLAFQKDLADKNYKAQLGMTRGNIGDQSAARYAANPGATGASSAAEYTHRQLAKYGVA